MSTTSDQLHQLEYQLKWDPEAVRTTTGACNGCGLCRTRGEQLRMCPVYRYLSDEIAAPRAKANVMEGVLDHQLELEILTDPMVKTIADLCLNCQMCRVECPAQVDVPFLAFRFRTAYAAAHGMSATDLFYAKIDTILKWSMYSGLPLNTLLKNRFCRWLLEKTLGVPQGRKLPKIAKIPYLSKIAWTKRLTRPSRRANRKIALLLDTYTNYCDARLADIAIKVLEFHGFSVLVPPQQQSSGLTAISAGHGEQFERLVRKNVAVYSDLVRQGYQIITMEPSSAVCLKHEYQYVSSDPDGILVSENTQDICSFLYSLHLQGNLRLQLRPLQTTVGYHAPCRTLVLNYDRAHHESFEPMLRAGNLLAPTPAESLLRLIPGLDVRRLERGCCGLSGTFGLKKTNYPMSLRLGIRLFSALRDPAIQSGTTECNACLLQMEQGTTKRVFHPIKILAYSYGLADDFAE